MMLCKVDIPVICYGSNVEENILRAAGQLFSRYGIRGVSLDDISRALGISKKTFYKYFHDKEVLVKVICDRKSADLMAALQKAGTQKDAFTEASEIFDILLNFIAGFSAHFFRDIEMRYPRQYQSFVLLKKNIIEYTLSGNIQKGISTGEYKNSIDPPTIAGVWFELVVLCCNQGYRADQVRQHFLDGLINMPYLKRRAANK